MKQSALILLAALVMASSARARSCNHTDAHPGAPCSNGLGHFHVCAATIANPDQLFNPAITPSTGPNRYKSPACRGGGVVDPQDQALFNSVFQRLNATTGGQGVSNKFCRKLHDLFVLPAGSNAYGVWEIPGRGNESMFIALPSQVGGPKTLADQENIMLAAAFAGSGKPVPAGLKYVSVDKPYVSAKQPGDGMALLAILAHELGHLLLADSNADGTGDPPTYVHPRSHPGNGNCDTPAANPCFESKFLAPPGTNNTLWNRDLFHHNMRRWIDFGGPHARNNNKYQDLAHDLDAVINGGGNFKTFLNGEFVSIYASVSPEEDFVETYKYKILADVAQASKLQLQFPDGSYVNVLDNMSGAAAGSNLRKKIDDCVTPLTP
jgi:hypothetical protein